MKKRVPPKYATEFGVRFPDGREVCDLKTAAGRREYRQRVETMLREQGGRCCIGGELLALESATFEHEDGRTAGRRDDRVRDSAGRPVNGAACLVHNCIKGSRREAYLITRE